MFLNNKVYFDNDDKDLTMEPKKPVSLWTFFLDAIQRYPRFKKLKNIIERAKIEKDSYDQLVKRKCFEEYFLKKRHEKYKMEHMNKV